MITREDAYNLFNETYKYLLKNVKERTTKEQESRNMQYLLSANRNLQDLGFSMSIEMIDIMKSWPKKEIVEAYNELMQFCESKTGNSVKKGELFYPNFPEEVMNADEVDLYLNAFIAYVSGAAIGENIHFHEEAKEREQLIEAFERKPKILNSASKSDFLNLMEDRMFYGKVLPSEKREELLSWMSRSSEWKQWIQEKDIPIKENKIAIAKYIHDNDSKNKPFLKYMLRDSVDVLRYATAISVDSVSEANLELKGHVSFKIKNKEADIIFNASMLDTVEEGLKESVKIVTANDISEIAGNFLQLKQELPITDDSKERELIKFIIDDIKEESKPKKEAAMSLDDVINAAKMEALKSPKKTHTREKEDYEER